MRQFLLALILCVSPAMAAGINGGGNGGGFAEMMTVLADQTLADQIQACSSNGSSCNLTSRQAEYATRFLKQLPVLQQIPLRFNPECGADHPIQVQAEAILIPSCLLYRDSVSLPASPLPIRDLYLVALEARLRQAGEWSGEGFALLSPVFKSVLSEEQVSTAASAEAETSLHATVFEQSWYESKTYFSIETPAGTWDITGRVVGALACDQQAPAKNWRVRLIDGEELASRRMRFQGEIVWECGTYSMHAKLRIIAPLDADLGLRSEDVLVTLTQQERY